MDKKFFLYIMTNKHNTVLYLGVTNNIKRRSEEHRSGAVEGFTKKYNCHKLVWFEEFEDIKLAIEREKTMKKWHREYKIKLISEKNPDWIDLYEYL